MKYNYIYSLLILLLVTVIVPSCSKMNDLHQPYLDKGEIIYAAKVDSVAPGAGNARIQLKLFIISQRIETVRIFWNDYKDSSDVAIANQTGVKTKMLNSMPEKSYIFQFVSLDKFGHRSLPFETVGKVYGPNFQSTLSNRVIKSQTALVNGKITIVWSGAVDQGVRCDLIYTNTANQQVTRKIPMTENTTILTDVSKEMKYNTLFLPEPTAIDTFYTSFRPVIL
jgi:hypothetical protein